MRTRALWFVLTAIASGTAPATWGQDLPRGQIIDDVRCAGDASQHYALYVPSNFTPTRRWPVILGFDAGGRGRRAVERYQAAAEKYGYLVAGSNNSRNGPWPVSLDAAKAMAADVDARFPVDSKRKYTAGMSGGARVAMLLALSPEPITGRFGPPIAGVFASSAGFPEPDVDFKESVPFPIFGTAGTDDFNHQEMRQLDRGVKTPHRVEVFEGGHVWLPVALATDGVEWMEIQAMIAGLRDRDQKLIDDIFARRLARADAQQNSLEQMRALKSIAEDFRSFKDVVTINRRVAALERRQDVKDRLEAERTEERRELQTRDEVYRLVGDVERRDNLARLEERLTKLLEESKAAADSPNRRIARRVLAGLNASSRGIRNPELRELLARIRPPSQPGGPQ
jgi:hypothetical protein